MGVVIEMAGEISFLAQGNLGPRSRRLAGCFTLTRLVGQISPANGALVAAPERDYDGAGTRARRALAGPADPWYDFRIAGCAGDRGPRPAQTHERFALAIGMNDA